METVKEQFERLRNEWIEAATPAERQGIDAQIRKLADGFPEEFDRAFYEGAVKAADAARGFNVRREIDAVAPMINFSYIAENYFHRSRAWLSQRLNGSAVNGKPVSLSTDDIATLASALADMGGKVSAAAEKIRNH